MIGKNWHESPAAKTVGRGSSSFRPDLLPKPVKAAPRFCAENPIRTFGVREAKNLRKLN